MAFEFDLFRKDAAGLIWIGSAPILEEVMGMIWETRFFTPAEYIILHRRTGKRMSFNVDEATD